MAIEMILRVSGAAISTATGFVVFILARFAFLLLFGAWSSMPAYLSCIGLGCAVLFFLERSFRQGERVG